MKPTFFATPADLRAWFEKNAEKKTELLVGFHKKGSGKPSMSLLLLRRGCYPGKSALCAPAPRRGLESVDEALCVGWIDGVRRRIDDTRYSIQRSAIYAYEQRRSAALAPDQEKRFKRNAKAWRFFSAQPPGYRRLVTHWVVSGKKEETRARRLAVLIADSAAGRRIRQLTRP